MKRAQITLLGKPASPLRTLRVRTFPVSWEKIQTTSLFSYVLNCKIFENSSDRVFLARKVYSFFTPSSDDTFSVKDPTGIIRSLRAFCLKPRRQGFTFFTWITMHFSSNIFTSLSQTSQWSRTLIIRP